MSSINHFFLPLDSFSGSDVHFPPDISRQIVRVLRLQAGEQVIALNNCGDAYIIKLTDINPNRAAGIIAGRYNLDTEPDFTLLLYLALTQREKFELILQKCTELGAHVIIPMVTERSLVTKSHTDQQKTDRRVQIIREAAEQSHRLRLPELKPVETFEQSLKTAIASGSVILLHESSEIPLGTVLDGLFKEDAHREISLFIGPEGGFSEDEIEAAQQCGAQVCSLGPRVLRMETAAIAATAITVEIQSRYQK